MKVTNKNSPAFGRLSFKEINGIKLPVDFKCKNKLQQNVSVRFRPAQGGSESFVYDSFGKLQASDKSSIANNRIFVDIMAAKPQEAGKGSGLLLHLSKIIMMLENGFNKIEFDAALDSYSYHRKFKYQSHITNESKIYEALKKLSQCKENSLATIVKEMKNFLNNPPQDSKTLFKGANGLINSFIDKAIEEKIPKKNLPDCSIDMILSRKKALENKDFYNKLFEKSDIDYRIS